MVINVPHVSAGPIGQGQGRTGEDKVQAKRKSKQVSVIREKAGISEPKKRITTNDIWQTHIHSCNAK